MSKKKSRVKRSPKETKSQLLNCVQDLINDANLYDKGQFSSIKRSSGVLRMLFYESRYSHSIIKQLGDKEQLEMFSFTETALDNYVVYFGPVYTARFNPPFLNNEKFYDTFLFMPEQSKQHRLDFHSWWNSGIFKLNGILLTRGGLAVTMANQDGGAHFDPKLDSEYYNVLTGKTGFNITLTRDNSFFMGEGSSEGDNIQFVDLQNALMREIVHETILSLISWYDLPLQYEADFDSNKKRLINPIPFHFTALKEQ